MMLISWWWWGGGVVSSGPHLFTPVLEEQVSAQSGQVFTPGSEAVLSTKACRGQCFPSAALNSVPLAPQINPTPQRRSPLPRTSGGPASRCHGTGRPTTEAAPCSHTTWRCGTLWSSSGNTWCPATAPRTTYRCLHPPAPPSNHSRCPV